MNLKLCRKEYIKDGIFSDLLDENGNIVAHTLEHAYVSDWGMDAGCYKPKLTAGTYTCVRGPHRLHNMTSDFTTFEITGVSGHTNILFHWGNYNKDSDGCVLLGRAVSSILNSPQMITNSRDTFAKFMELQKDIDKFTLTVVA